MGRSFFPQYCLRKSWLITLWMRWRVRQNRRALSSGTIEKAAPSASTSTRAPLGSMVEGKMAEAAMGRVERNLRSNSGERSNTGADLVYLKPLFFPVTPLADAVEGEG